MHPSPLPVSFHCRPVSFSPQSSHLSSSRSIAPLLSPHLSSCLCFILPSTSLPVTPVTSSPPFFPLHLFLSFPHLSSLHSFPFSLSSHSSVLSPFFSPFFVCSRSSVRPPPLPWMKGGSEGWTNTSGMKITKKKNRGRDKDMRQSGRVRANPFNSDHRLLRLSLRNNVWNNLQCLAPDSSGPPALPTTTSLSSPCSHLKWPSRGLQPLSCLAPHSSSRDILSY